MSDIIAEVRDTYDQIAPYFSRTRVTVWPEMKKYLRKLKDGDRVLDIGCGNGRLLNGVSAKIDYLGVDFSSGLIKEAKRLHPDKKFGVKDITSEFGWKGLDRYDALFCVAVLHHIPYREQQLAIVRKIGEHLENDGFGYISVWSLWKSRYWWNHLASLPMKLRNWRWLKVPFEKKYLRFCTALDKEYLIRLVEEAELKVEEAFETSGNICVIVKRI